MRSRAASGLSEPLALSSGLHKLSSRDARPVSAIGCRSNQTCRARERRSASRRLSSGLISRLLLPTRRQAPPGLRCIALPASTSTSMKALPSSFRRAILGAIGGLIELRHASTSRSSRASICSRERCCSSPASVTPQSRVPPSALASAASSSASCCWVGRFGLVPENSICLNSQRASSPRSESLERRSSSLTGTTVPLVAVSLKLSWLLLATALLAAAAPRLGYEQSV